MKDLNFNIYGLAAPKTPLEYIALLDEAIRMADEMADQIVRDDAFLERHDVAAAAWTL